MFSDFFKMTKILENIVDPIEKARLAYKTFRINELCERGEGHSKVPVSIDNYVEMCTTYREGKQIIVFEKDLAINLIKENGILVPKY